MNLHPFRNMSRLKKKLLLYFILVALVSISVSAEIIFEMSTSDYKTTLASSIMKEAARVNFRGEAELGALLSAPASWAPVDSLRNRMILLLIVISAAMMGALYLFVRDIVSPMDGVVEAAKRIASGDFSAVAPVQSKDEIGQLAELINDMNINIQDVVVHIKREVDRHKQKIDSAMEKNDEALTHAASKEVLFEKRIKISSYLRLIEINEELKVLLWRMNNDITSMQSYVGSYRTYAIPDGVTQEEIEESLKAFRSVTGREEDNGA